MGRHYRGLPIHAAAGVHEHALTLVQENAPIGATVLDVGCGVGALAQRLADAEYLVTASDIDISDYRADPPAIEWDVTADPPGQSFDVVCAIEVLEHVENPLGALRNMRSLLTPSGVLIVSTPNLGHIRSRIKYLLRGAPGYFGPNEYHVTGHRTLLPDWLLVRHLEAVGFTQIAVTYAGRFDLTGFGRLPYAALKKALRLAGRMRTADDGAATFVVARP